MSATRQTAILCGILSSALVLRALWPGDIAFVNDEPILLGMAQAAWQAGDRLPLGLQGSQGLHYGPLPLWLYGAAMAVIPDLPLLVAVKAVVVALTTWVGVWMLLGESFKRPALLLLMAYSPYLWLYDRALWDNSLLVPLSALGMGFHARYCRTGRWAYAFACWLSLCAALLCHLMALATVLAVVAHTALREMIARQWRPRVWASQVAAFTLGMAPMIPYLAKAIELRAPSTREVSWSLVAPLHALAGVKLFTFLDFDYFLGLGNVPLSHLEGAPRWIGAVASHASMALLLLAPLGVARLFTRSRSFGDKLADPAWGLPVLVLIAQVCEFLLAGIRLHPNYYNGAWSAYLAMMALGLQMADRWRGGAALATALAVLLAVGTWCAAISLHLTGGNRAIHYGPTLANNLSLAGELNRRGTRDFRVHPATRHHRLFPHTLLFLRDYLGRGREGPGPPTFIVYEFPDLPYDGRVVLFSAAAPRQ